jgi:cytochrome c-type biogenesis protein CcmH
MKTKYLVLLSFFLLLLTSFVVPAVTVVAQTPTPSDDEVNAIASEMYCPICENTPLDVCPTDACRDWRELIRQMLAQGKTSAEIEQYFVDHYGARVLSEPPQKGFNLLLYLTPWVAIVIGVLVVFLGIFLTWYLRSKKTRPEALTNSEPDKEDEYTSRLEDEIRKRK